MSSALHITNGDCTDVAGTGLAEEVLVWFDVLHEGPVPDLPAEELRNLRAEFLASADDAFAGADVLPRFVARDRTLQDHRDGDYVLWFKADLYDQLQIVQILARLAELGVPAERINLICIGEYPGIARFGGLGELTADQLRELPATAASAQLTPAALGLAGRAWSALRAPQPDGLAAIASQRSGELRFLAEAFDRLAREFPSTRDGLSLTERRILAAIGAGPLQASSVFEAAAGRETRPYLGDTWCFAAMDRLARADAPLLVAEPAGSRVDAGTLLSLTGTGADVLAARADHVALNGVDRWVGGVHLHGRDVAWRFDEGTEEIRRPGSA
jgi:hypothetical protein